MLNHFRAHLQEPQPWFHNLNHFPGAENAGELEAKEAMFEKPLTPSDVGKLNRLVIPKQHAERYFPLSAGDSAGMLLGFEDESGKSWRFRYSYWNSSQSYVLTKGWSRYVKDKRLDAGDVVFFQRHRADRHKLFIGWRRRGAAPSSPICYNAPQPPNCPPPHPRGGPIEEEENATRVQSASNNINNDNSNNPRRLVRLFGVNFECEREESSVAVVASEPEGSSSIINQAQQQQQQQQAYHNYLNYYSYMGLGGYPGAAPSTYRHHQMNMEFAERQMGNRLG